MASTRCRERSVGRYDENWGLEHTQSSKRVTRNGTHTNLLPKLHYRGRRGMKENECGLWERGAVDSRKGAVKTKLEVRRWLVYIRMPAPSLIDDRCSYPFCNERASASGFGSTPGSVPIVHLVGFVPGHSMWSCYLVRGTQLSTSSYITGPWSLTSVARELGS